MSLEYVFFDERPRRAFIDRVERLGLDYRSGGDDGELLVRLPEEIDGGVLAEVEAAYDEMMGFSESLIAADDDSHYHAAGVQVNLQDGSQVLASVPPVLLNRVLQALTFEELQQFVDAIARAVESPDTRPICKRA